MKKRFVNKILISGIMILICVILIVMYYSKPTSNISEPFTNQIASEDQQSSISSLLSNNQAQNNVNSVIRKETEKVLEDTGDIIDTKEDSVIKESTPNMPKEKTPAEILQKYNAILSSPEFMAEARNILANSKIEQIDIEKKIRELENKEKELEQNMEADPIDKRQELQTVRDTLWEARVNLAKKVILMDDAYQKLKLKYITVDEIRIAQQEIKKTPPPFPIGSGSEENTIDTMARLEAVRRLEADGWVSNPLRSYQ